jgi:hypothetical protein
MSSNGKARSALGYAVQPPASPLLSLALTALRRAGIGPVALAECNGQPCHWARDIADCLARGLCHRAVLLCDDAGLVCCVANKVPGVRAVPASTIWQARRAVAELGANVLAVEQAGRTYFELREIMRLCATPDGACPPGVACVLQELDGHAHR